MRGTAEHHNLKLHPIPGQTHDSEHALPLRAQYPTLKRKLSYLTPGGLELARGFFAPEYRAETRVLVLRDLMGALGFGEAEEDDEG